jgi:cell wall-associated NlpC family hydrolase
MSNHTGLTCIVCLAFAGMIGCTAPALRIDRTEMQAAVPQANQRMAMVIESYIGTPYRYGGASKRGMDCSGFVFAVYNNIYRISLPHSSRALFDLTFPVSNQRYVMGDLVFFSDSRKRRINHVGIFIDGSTFAHASPKKGVVYSSLEESYFKRRYAGIHRLF